MVSIIITTYNRVSYLKQCLDSIIIQIDKDTEIIVIDDASTQNVREVIDLYTDINIKYYRMDNNSGNFAKLKNFGLNMASGEIIAFCDDDDLWYADKIKKQLGKISEYDFICSNANIIDENNNHIEEHFFPKDSENLILTTDILLVKNRILFSTVIFKRSILNGKYFLDENIKNMVEDFEFYLRISPYIKIFYFGENLASIRRHENFTYSGENYMKMIFSNIQVLTNYKKKGNPKYRFYSKAGIIGSYFSVVKIYYRKKEYIKCLKFLFIMLSSFSDLRLFIYFFNKLINRNI